MIAKCEKWKVYSRVLRVTFFAFHAPFFAFRISCQGWHSGEKSKDFMIYFFAALIKQKISIKYKKYIVSVSNFVVCSAKTFAIFPGNVKYEMYPAQWLSSHVAKERLKGMKSSSTLTSTFRKIVLLSHFLCQRFLNMWPYMRKRISYRSDLSSHVAKERLKGMKSSSTLTSMFRKIALLSHFLCQSF